MLFDFTDIKVKRRELRRLPEIPDTGWRPPTEFPNLTNAVMLSVDTETYDPNLLDRGPGWARGDGHICGFSLGAIDSHGNTGKWYFPLRHTVGSNLNLDEASCLRYLASVMSTSTSKVGANLTYDLGWLKEYGITIRGDLHDTQYAEALIAEGTKSGLDHCAAKYLGEHKEGELVYEWCSDAYGGKPNDRQRANLWRAPPQLVGPYGEADADLPLRVIQHQLPRLQELGLWDVYRMECELIPLMVDMRFSGMSVDVNKAKQLHDELEGDIAKEYLRLFELSGSRGSANSPSDVAAMFDKAGIPYLRTEAGNPSFTKEFLEEVHHPIAEQILAIREMEKIRGTFIKSYILDSNVNGRVHGQFHQLKSDSGGAKTGRFASSTPNLQNIPSRTTLGKRVREAFVAHNGHCGVLAKDYSSVEYRILTHFAVGAGSDEVRQQFINDPYTDYHQVVMDLVHQLTGILLSRKHTKNINFASLYGAGVSKIALMLKVSVKQAEELLAAYHRGAPYVQATMDYFIKKAADTGEIRTILGRRSLFEKWEPVRYDPKSVPLDFEYARAKYGNNIKRAGLYKGTNYAVQGTAAEVMKAGMLAAYKAGVFDVTGVPMATVHDELVFSLIEKSPEQEEAYREMERLLTQTIPLSIPLVMDTEIANDWGTVKETNWSKLVL